MTISMPAIASPRPISRFFRTPKGLLLVLFSALLALASAETDAKLFFPNLALAAGSAGALDVALTRYPSGKWIIPDGALLTGAIIAMVLRPQEPAEVVLLASVVAIGSKHLLRTRWSNILNPAALALVFAAVFLQAGESWWGALPDLGLVGVTALVVGGGFIADRINKLPMVLAFGLTYFSLFTVASFFQDAALVSEIFRSPDLHAVLFFAFFMLDDPPTSPVRYEDQVVFGIIVATVAYLVFMTEGALYFLPAALLAGNAWESARRVVFSRRRRQQREI